MRNEIIRIIDSINPYYHFLDKKGFDLEVKKINYVESLSLTDAEAAYLKNKLKINL